MGEDAAAFPRETGRDKMDPVLLRVLQVLKHWLHPSKFPIFTGDILRPDNLSFPQDLNIANRVSI